MNSNSRSRRRTILAAMTGLVLAATTATTATAQAEGSIVRASQPTPGSYVVTLKDSTVARSTDAAAAVSTAASQLTARYGGKVVSTYSRALQGYSAWNLDESAARRLAADPRVAKVYENGTAHTAQDNATWGLDRVDQRDSTLDQKYNPEGTGEGVTAYDLDTGLTTGHPDFEGRAQAGEDFIKDSSDVNKDCGGHGTHTAGTIGSKTWGVAKKVSLVGVKILGCGGSSPDSKTIDGIEWVIKNAKKPALMNMSLTFDTPDIGTDAVNKATDAGITSVVAAGNDGGDACSRGPAKVKSAITVGSIDQGDGRSGFSNYGTCVDLFAPGGNITSASNSGSGSSTMSGTSMATPHVAGAVALYLQSHPDAKPAEVEKAILDKSTPNKVGNPGAGSPNKLLYVGK